MIDIVLFFFLFVPMLNMIRMSKGINTAIKLCIIMGAIGLFSAWCAKEVTEKPENYYEMIGIGAREQIEEGKIKKLFRKKSLLYHPDKFKQMNPNANDAEIEVAQAKFIKLQK